MELGCCRVISKLKTILPAQRNGIMTDHMERAMTLNEMKAIKALKPIKALQTTHSISMQTIR